MSIAYLHRPPNTLLHAHNGLRPKHPPRPLDIVPPMRANNLHPERRKVRLAASDSSHSLQKARQHEAQRARDHQNIARRVLLRVCRSPDRAHEVPEEHGFAVGDKENAAGDL